MFGVPNYSWVTTWLLSTINQLERLQPTNETRHKWCRFICKRRWRGRLTSSINTWRDNPSLHLYLKSSVENIRFQTLVKSKKVKKTKHQTNVRVIAVTIKSKACLNKTFKMSNPEPHREPNWSNNSESDYLTDEETHNLHNLLIPHQDHYHAKWEVL